MKRLSILLFCFCAFGQSAPPPDEQKVPNQDFGLAVDTNGHPVGNIEILSDTQGVDFGPYLNRILPTIRQNWFLLIPDSAKSKKGKLAIEFAITKDGKVPDMRLVASSGDVDLDRSAWGSITASNPFPPLPGDFTGLYLALRFRFYYNPDKSDLAPNRSTPGISAKASSAPADLQVPVGGSVVTLKNSIACRGNSNDVVGCVTPPRQTRAPEPKYPKKEQKARHQGMVTLKLVVGSDGVPTDISVAQTLSPDFDKAAIDAVRKWKFAPATKDGNPVAVEIAVEVEFHLTH